MKIELPAVSKPTNTLVNAVRVGDMLYVSGTGPGKVDGKALIGRLGQDYDVKQGRAAARQVGLHILSVVKAELGSLDKVQRLVKTLGMVNAAPDFKRHPEVINGFSDLMVEVFGAEAGKEREHRWDVLSAQWDSSGDRGPIFSAQVKVTVADLSVRELRNR